MLRKNHNNGILDRMCSVRGTSKLILTLTTAIVMTSSNAVVVSNATTNELEEINQVVVSTVIPTVDNELTDTIKEAVAEQELLKQEIAAEVAKQERLEAIAARETYINSIVCDPSNVSRVTGLKEEDYSLLTQGTWWEGNEQALIDLERNYGVNAMFAMAVSTLESGSGSSDRAKSRNNYYGLELPNYWNNLYDNTQYWGNCIKENYVGENRLSTYNISPKYCPPNSAYWGQYTHDKMRDLYNQLIIKLKATEV